jgi:hypothetical protein
MDGASRLKASARANRPDRARRYQESDTRDIPPHTVLLFPSMATALACKGCGESFERRPGPGRPREHCYTCRPAPAPLPELPSIVRLEPVARVERDPWHPDDPRALEDRELRERAAELGLEAEQLIVLAEAKRREAATLVARADRLRDPSQGVRPPKAPTALERAREDGLLAAAALAVEDLHDGFEASDLAYMLDIPKETQRTATLLVALEALGKVRRHGDGWAHHDPEERRVRDFVVGAQEFTEDDMGFVLDMPALDVRYYLERFKARGIVSNGGATYRYVPPPDDAPRSRPRRRPPELDPPAGTDAPKRGEPVRIVDHGQGAAAGGKHRMKLKQQAWERQETAKQERAAEQRRKARGK